MISDLLYRLRALFRRRSMEAEMDEELHAHLEHQVAKYVQSGMSREEARRRAKIKLGGLEQVKEECRDSWGVALITELCQDLRYGLRQLRRSPGFTAVAVITLALGIGANTAIFSVVSTVLIHPLPYSDSRLPYDDPGRLVWITEFVPRISSLVGTAVPVPDYLHWREQNQVFQSVAAYGGVFAGPGGIDLGDRQERIDATGVTWNFLPMLGIRPASGRNFLPEEDRPGGPPVVILSYALWQQRFRSDPKLVGKMITLSETRLVGRKLTLKEKGYTVIGIMSESFHFPADRNPELFAPLSLAPNTNWDSLSFGAVHVIARLKRGVSLDRATSDLITINQRSDKALPSRFAQMHSMIQVRMETLHEHLVGNIRPLLLILLGAVGFVLLLACANVANLQLARAATRGKEFAVRAAIGAGRWRLARQLLVESLALAVLGGAAGLFLGAGGVALIRRLGPPNIPALQSVGFDPWVFAFIAAISAFAGIAVALAPAMVASGLNLDETLKESRPSTTAGGGAQRWRALLMISEVALALILLTGAGLLVRSFVLLTSVYPGFDPRHLLTERVALPLGKYPEPAQWTPFFQSVLERVGGLPGVESVAAASDPPLTDARMGGLVIEGQPTPRGMLNTAIMCIISPSYFHALRVPLVSGRDFAASDDASALRVAIVNEIFARRFFGQGEPLGQRIRLGEGDWYLIVGVVPSTRHLPLTTVPSAEVYTCYLQQPSYSMTLIVRAASNPASLAGAVRGKVQEVDRNQPVSDVATMEERFTNAVAPQRFNALVMVIFAGMALILAGVGVYGVMAYSATRRTHEIGIRRALGAQQKDVMKLVLRRGLWLVVFGVGVGIGGALALTRFLSSLLYDVKPRDPMTFSAVSLVLAAVAVLACYIPARRAAKVDPMVALRYE